MREDDEFSSSASDEGEEQPSSEQIEQYQPNGVISHMKEEGEDGKRRTKARLCSPDCCRAGIVSWITYREFRMSPKFPILEEDGIGCFVCGAADTISAE